MSAVKRVEFVSDRMSYIILRGRWFHITVLNVHAPRENKTEDVKDSFYEELECVTNSLNAIKSKGMRWAGMWREWGRTGTCIGYW
jgi:hypothetical protein